MKTTRREFAKALGGAGIGSLLALGGGSLQGEAKPSSGLGPGQPDTTVQPVLRRLGRTGLMLSRVGFGAQHTRDPELIRYALDQGINHIETAWAYGAGRPDNSCECIGKAIAGRRDSAFLAVAYSAEPSPTSRAWLPNQFEQTLRDLGTDHIDVFLWHHPGGGSINNSLLTSQQSQALVAAGERMDLMLKWKREGKIRWCGVTAHSEQVEWLKFVVESKLYEVAVLAFNYNSSQALARAMQEASQAGIGLIAMKTQSPNYADGEAQIGMAPDHRQALSWVLSKNYVTAAIPGMTTRDQVDLNLNTMRSAS
jgi:aryl-alcohol dehydrogenase-like predicted oxidoreductase